MNKQMDYFKLRGKAGRTLAEHVFCVDFQTGWRVFEAISTVVDDDGQHLEPGIDAIKSSWLSSSSTTDGMTAGMMHWLRFWAGNDVRHPLEA